MEIDYTNRMIDRYQTMAKQWPAVKIVKGIPEHPEGAIRRPRPEQREAWERQGICVLAPEHDEKTAPGGNLANARQESAPQYDEPVASVPRSKKRRKKK